MATNELGEEAPATNIKRSNIVKAAVAILVIVAVGFIGYASGGKSSSTKATKLDYDPITDGDDIIDYIKMYETSIPSDVSVDMAIEFLKYGTRPYTPYYEDQVAYAIDATDSQLYCYLSYSGNYDEEYLETEYVDSIACTVYTKPDFESDDFFYRTNFAKTIMAAETTDPTSQAALAKKFYSGYSQVSKKESTEGIQPAFSTIEKMLAVKSQSMAKKAARKLVDNTARKLVKESAGRKPAGVPSASEVAAVLMVASEVYADPGSGVDTWGCSYTEGAVPLVWASTPEGDEPVTITCNFYHANNADMTGLFRNTFGFSKK